MLVVFDAIASCTGICIPSTRKKKPESDKLTSRVGRGTGALAPRSFTPHPFTPHVLAPMRAVCHYLYPGSAGTQQSMAAGDASLGSEEHFVTECYLRNLVIAAVFRI